MRGLFYYRTHLDDPQNAGVIKKCRHMAAAFQAYGLSADTVFFGQKGLIFNETANWEMPLATTKGSVGHALLYYFQSEALLLRHVNFADYDFLFIRHLPAHPLLLHFLKKIKRQNPTLRILLEFPTWPYDLEMKGLKNKLLLFVDRLTRNRLKHYVDVALHNGAETDIWGIPTIRIANGIHPADFQPFPQPAVLPDYPFKLVFVGNISHWHGLDRLIHGLKAYKKPEDIRICIVGAGSEKAALVDLVERLELQTSVQFLPPVDQRGLRAVYAQAHLAIGSLALHRLGLPMGVPLKHREYFACGLPFIFSGHDPDFDGVEGAFSIPANETSVDVGTVVARFFALKNSKENYRAALHEYAVQSLCWERQIKPIIHYLFNGKTIDFQDIILHAER